MSKRALFLGVVFLLFTNVLGQFANFNAPLTGAQMIPPVNSQRTAVLQVLFYPSGSPGLANPNGDPYGLGVYYTITTDINDFTGFSLYAPAPGDTGPLLIDVPTTIKSGKAVIPVAGSETNYSAVFAYQNFLRTYFNIGFAYAILRTTAFPNGELRGDFGTATFRIDQFFGGSTFPFPATDAIILSTFIACDTPLTGTSVCRWNSALPIGGSAELQGPNGLLVQLTPSQLVGPGPGPGFAGLGTFTVPSPFTVAQLIDFGKRGELRLSYKIGTTEVASTALAIVGKPPTFEAKLNGANVVPPVTTSATGTVDVVFDQFRTITLTHTVSDATRFTLNSGAAGVNGDELINFLPGLSPIPGDLQFALDLYSGLPFYNLITDSQQGYITLSSTANPKGEIRGQLTVLPNNEFSDTLSGQKMVPSVSSQLTGQAVLRYDSLLNALYFNISSTSTSTSAVLLRGPANSTSTGPILATLCSFKCNLRRIFFGVLQADSGAFSSGQTISSTVEVLLKGEAYVELQTTQNPSGELRANLVASINNNPPSQLQDSFFIRPDIDIITGLPSPSPSIPRFFRRRTRAH